MSNDSDASDPHVAGQEPAAPAPSEPIVGDVQESPEAPRAAFAEPAHSAEASESSQVELTGEPIQGERTRDESLHDEPPHGEPAEFSEAVTPEVPAAATPAPETASFAAAPAMGAQTSGGAAEDREPSAGEAAKDEFFEIAKTIVYALLIALVLRIFFFQPFTIPSASMEPNLYEGDYIIVSKWDYGYSKHSIPFSPPLFNGRALNLGHGPQRGDIVVFKLPSDNKTDYIKRVIGLPGDTLQMRENQLYINGQAVPNVHVGKPDILPPAEAQYADIEAYRETLPNGRTHLMQDFGPLGRLDNTGVYTVPAGYYFMMGDNRDNSQDSRVPKEENGVGYVPAENLVGRARVILFSWHEGASLWKPWTWFTKLRLSRFFHGLQ